MNTRLSAREVRCRVSACHTASVAKAPPPITQESAVISRAPPRDAARRGGPPNAVRCVDAAGHRGLYAPCLAAPRNANSANRRGLQLHGGHFRDGAELRGLGRRAGGGRTVGQGGAGFAGGVRARGLVAGGGDVALGGGPVGLGRAGGEGGGGSGTAAAGGRERAVLFWRGLGAVAGVVVDGALVCVVGVEGVGFVVVALLGQVVGLGVAALPAVAPFEDEEGEDGRVDLEAAHEARAEVLERHEVLGRVGVQQTDVASDGE